MQKGLVPMQPPRLASRIGHLALLTGLAALLGA